MFYEYQSVGINRRSAIFGFLAETVTSVYGWIPTHVGVFSNDSDIGETVKRGSTKFNEASGEYMVNGGGAKLWGTNDAFHFVWKRAAGNLIIAADAKFTDVGRAQDPIALLMIRQNLEPDSVYVAVVLHASGFAALQFRAVRGGKTVDYPSKVKSPPRIRLERSGDVITAYGGPPGRERSGIASTVMDPGPVYAGLGVCSGVAKTTATAVFSRLEWIE